MFKSSRVLKKCFGTVCALIIAAGTSYAVELGNIEIHGYGHQGFVMTDGNIISLAEKSGSAISKADNQGTFDYSNIALLFSDRITDKNNIWIQLYGNSNHIRLDWAFIDHKFNNQLIARVGQIKTPTAIYNEIRDVKFLQLSTIEPFMYFEDSLVSEAYRGIGITYDKETPGGKIVLDAFGGETVNFEEHPEKRDRVMIGGRLTCNTPIEGLRIMASAQTYNTEEIDTGERGNEKKYMASIDYANHGIDLKAEYFYLSGFQPLVPDLYSYYIQAGYTLFDRLTPFARYDYLVTDKNQESDPSYYQKDITVGIGYKINSNIIFKAENHFMEGYSMPVLTMGNDFDASSANKNWNLTAFSMNFMF